MALSTELGLRVLLAYTAGIVLPVYSMFKALDKKDQEEQQKWLLYWAAYGSFNIAEAFSLVLSLFSLSLPLWFSPFLLPSPFSSSQLFFSDFWSNPYKTHTHTQPRALFRVVTGNTTTFRC